MSEKQPKTQQTQPTKGKPVEIPVLQGGDVLRDLKKVAKPPKGSQP